MSDDTHLRLMGMQVGRANQELWRLHSEIAQMRRELGEVKAALRRIEGQVLISQTEVPRKLAEIIAAIVREELARSR